MADNKNIGDHDMTQFSEGDAVWLSDGRKAEFVAATSQGCVVRLGFYRPSDDPEYGDEYFDAVEIVPQCFAEAPVKDIDARVTELLAQETAARERLRTVESEITAKERQHSDRIKKLAKYPPLDMLEALLEGRVTHFAVMNHYGIVAEVQTFEEATTRIDRDYGREKKDLRMLSLIGKGDLLAWQVNEWIDGSGTYRNTVYPCLSYEDARRKVAEICLTAARGLARDKIDSRHIEVVKNAEKYQIEIPSWIAESVTAKMAEVRAAKIANAEAELAKVRAEATP